MAKGNALTDGPAPRATREKREIDHYQVTDAIGTLARAEQIKGDKMLMRHVNKTMQKVASITPAPRKRR